MREIDAEFFLEHSIHRPDAAVVDGALGGGPRPRRLAASGCVLGQDARDVMWGDDVVRDARIDGGSRHAVELSARDVLALEAPAARPPRARSPAPCPAP